jgi:hypothetical protein
MWHGVDTKLRKNPLIFYRTIGRKLLVSMPSSANYLLCLYTNVSQAFLSSVNTRFVRAIS